MRTRHLWTHASAIVLTLLLTACGGGGGGSPSSPPIVDADNDGVADAQDAFPNDPSESADTDSDGIGNNADVDDDGDGLIEIASLQELDWMRFDLEGTSLNDGNGTVSSDGCPIGLCNGYELIADLDFDTNADGAMDASDTYFDYDGDGSDAGWLPIGNEDAPFRGNFDGNGFSIRNLYIKRPDPSGVALSEIGLFGRIDGSDGDFGFFEPPGTTVANLRIEGPLTAMEGDNAGGLAGRAIGTELKDIVVSGNITGNDSGGLVAVLFNASIDRGAMSGQVVARQSGGGLVGELIGSGTGAEIADSRSSADVHPGFNAPLIAIGTAMGGLVGRMLDETRIVRSTASGDVWGRPGLDAPGGVGGLVGYVNGNTGANDIMAGQVNEAFLADSSATGAVRGLISVGGFIGFAENAVEVTESFATGTIAGYTPPEEGAPTGADVAPATAYAGGFIGRAYPNESTREGSIVLIKNCFTTSRIELASGLPAGGFIGEADNTFVRASFSSGRVDGIGSFRGGFVGKSGPGAQFYGNLSLSTLLIENTNDEVYPDIVGELQVGEGLFVGQSDNTFFENNYQVDHEYSAYIGAFGEVLGVLNPNAVGVHSLDNLQCPVAADDITCIGQTLYNQWAEFLNENDAPVWDFGTSGEVPGLSFGGTVYRDGDGDGNLD